MSSPTWKRATWGDLVTFEYGKPARYTPDGEVLVYGANGPFERTDQPLWEGPSVIIGRTGAYRGVHWSPTSGWSVDTGFFIRPKSKMDMRWAYYSLLTVDINGMDTGSAIPSTSRDALNAVPALVPPLQEQEAISGTLGALDDKIELNRRMSRTLEEIARAIFRSWFVDFDPVRGTATFPEDIRRMFPDRLMDSPIGLIPEGWEAVPINELVEAGRRQVSPAAAPDELFDHYSIPAFDAGRVPSPEPGKSIRSNKFVVSDGCVLLSKLNPRIERVWLPLPERGRTRISSTEFLVAHPHDGVTQEFLYGLFTSQPFQEQFASRVRGTSGSHQRVQPGDFLAMRTLLPPEQVVHAFSKTVEPLLQRTKLNLLESEALATLRDTLLPKLITGELRT